MPLEETLCSCPSDLFQSRSKDVSLWVVVHSHVLNAPGEAQHWLGQCVQLLGHDLLFPEQILANPLSHCFDSGLSPQIFQASWMSPIINPPEFLIMFHCLIEIFNGFKSSKFENRIFHNCEGQSQPHGFPWHSTPCWRCDRLARIALAQVSEETVVQKQPSLQPSHLIVSSFGQHESCNRIYGRTMYIIIICSFACAKRL
jgi:hypothetical protein